MNNIDIMLFISVIVMYLIIGCTIYLFILICKALRKYINSSSIRNENIVVKQSLGNVIKKYRSNNKMTQEFVDEAIGVS